MQSNKPAILVLILLLLCGGAAPTTQPTSAPRGGTEPYAERYRPQFHFSARKNWLNDPNGLVFYKGTYHLFFQHNPDGIDWGNMTWGHAVSRNLVGWTQVEHAIHPDALGTIFSGSAVVDWNNTSGFKAGPEAPLVALYTSAGGQNEASKGKPFTQSLTYSTDAGRTWMKYDKNPVVAHIRGDNRDPKVLWHAPTKRWIMALYLDGPDYALLASDDLKSWTHLQTLAGMPGTECPDFFELPIDGDAKNTRWVFWCANNRYVLGTFDGQTFTQTDGPYTLCDEKYCYAAQTYSDIPADDGRRIQEAWMRGAKVPEMPWNQQMAFPTVLTLRTITGSVRLCKEPIREIETLRTRGFHRKGVTLSPGGEVFDDFEAELIELVAEIEPGTAKRFGFELRGQRIVYDREAGALEHVACSSTKCELLNGRLLLHILVDRTSVETFIDHGRASTVDFVVIDPANRTLKTIVEDGTITLRTLDVYPLKSGWQ
ncbi:MAG: glycoside hydrolase family 32 protein [Phycisphaerae bacterium]|nr:glycoside hydrolase family 32 protein [Phycisphaerae bacterium]